MKITFFTSMSGRSYIHKFLDELSLVDRALVLAVFEQISHSGLSAIGCQFRQIEGKLWEIKIKGRDGGYRFFYVMLSQSEMHVLHAYRKKSQKAPKLELELARKRMKEVLQ